MVLKIEANPDFPMNGSIKKSRFIDKTSESGNDSGLFAASYVWMGIQKHSQQRRPDLGMPPMNIKGISRLYTYFLRSLSRTYF
ncbi:hypothetical protein CEXT_25161 [Caerostris extrusa]|uniref:Ycf15 n=1 Tax=Caerostris extrusa TaxID=172846 RepID=A0AAV4VF54_CAEEX|nr:hypothetical protein CEXT_25161 [Caerostris extrusa]